MRAKLQFTLSQAAMLPRLELQVDRNGSVGKRSAHPARHVNKRGFLPTTGSMHSERIGMKPITFVVGEPRC
jgi:hypothetical protein